MRRLLLDTGVLLELALFDLARSGERKAWSAVFSTPARHGRFMEKIDFQFGSLLYSIGSIIELERLALNHLVTGNKTLGALDGFWSAFHKLGHTLPRKMTGEPIERLPLSGNAFRLLGPFDAHLLQRLERDDELWLATIDADLQRIASELTRGRVMDPRLLS